MALKDDIATLLALLAERNTRESELLAALDGDELRLKRTLKTLHKRVLAKQASARSYQDTLWTETAKIIARCPWGKDELLALLLSEGYKGLSTRELAKLARSAEEPMRLLVRKMESEGAIKQVAVDGVRKWFDKDRAVALAGPQPPVTEEELLAVIAEHQPVRLELLSELLRRGRFYLRGEVHKLRREGKVTILGMDGSWLYTLPDYVRPGADIEKAILLRCEDAGGDCLTWSGAHDRQGHPLVRHDNGPRRVDIVLWTAVHGKKLKPGHTLARTCETPGCCNHEHHKQVTRKEAMKIAFDALGKEWRRKQARRISEAVREKVGALTPEQVVIVKTSDKSARVLSLELGCTKSVISACRRGETYKDYDAPRVASPFDGLLRAAA